MEEFTKLVCIVTVILAYRKNIQTVYSRKKAVIKKIPIKGSSWKLIPKSFSHSFRSVPGTGGEAGLVVLLRSSISEVFDKIN